MTFNTTLEGSKQCWSRACLINWLATIHDNDTAMYSVQWYVGSLRWRCRAGSFARRQDRVSLTGWPLPTGAGTATVAQQGSGSSAVAVDEEPQPPQPFEYTTWCFMSLRTIWNDGVHGWVGIELFLLCFFLWHSIIFSFLSWIVSVTFVGKGKMYN